MLEVREEGGVNDDVGMLGEVGVRLVFLAEVRFAEPDKHAGVAFQGGTELGAAQGVFEAGAALGRGYRIWRRGSQESKQGDAGFLVRNTRERRGRRGRDEGLAISLPTA